MKKADTKHALENSTRFKSTSTYVKRKEIELTNKTLDPCPVDNSPPKINNIDQYVKEKAVLIVTEVAQSQYKLHYDQFKEYIISFEQKVQSLLSSKVDYQEFKHEFTKFQTPFQPIATQPTLSKTDCEQLQFSQSKIQSELQLLSKKFMQMYSQLESVTGNIPHIDSSSYHFIFDDKIEEQPKSTIKETDSPYIEGTQTCDAQSPRKILLNKVNKMHRSSSLLKSNDDNDNAPIKNDENPMARSNADMQFISEIPKKNYISKAIFKLANMIKTLNENFLKSEVKQIVIPQPSAMHVEVPIQQPLKCPISINMQDNTEIDKKFATLSNTFQKQCDKMNEHMKQLEKSIPAPKVNSNKKSDKAKYESLSNRVSSIEVRIPQIINKSEVLMNKIIEVEKDNDASKRALIESKQSNQAFADFDGAIQKLRDYTRNQIRELKSEVERMKEPINLEISKLKSECELLLRELERTQQINRSMINDFAASLSNQKLQNQQCNASVPIIDSDQVETLNKTYDGESEKTNTRSRTYSKGVNDVKAISNDFRKRKYSNNITNADYSKKRLQSYISQRENKEAQRRSKSREQLSQLIQFDKMRPSIPVLSLQKIH